MQFLPGFILQYIQDISINCYSPAFLRLTPSGRLEEYGGDTQRYGIINPSIHMPAGEIAGYLEGLFPINKQVIILPGVETVPGVFADIHLLNENNELTWVLFLDKTADEKKLRCLLQQINEERLLRETCRKLFPEHLTTEGIAPPSSTYENNTQIPREKNRIKNKISKWTGIDILRQLDFATFEQIAVYRFSPIGSLPSWFETHFNKCVPFDKEGYINPATCFPFLEYFLNNEAKQVWEQNESSTVISDLWIQDDQQGNEYYFGAVALSTNHKRLLLLRRINPRTSRSFFYIQKGREKSLAYEKVIKTEKILRSFFANISHELRTPMNAILGISKMLQMYYNENLTDKQMEGLKYIYQSGERLLNLINNLLDLSKLEAGKMKVTPEPVNTDDLITEVEKLIPPLIKDKNIQFSVKKISPVPPLIVIDKEKILQVLLNLLGNAVKFTQQGEILFKVFKQDDKLCFEVKDTGIGIDETHLPDIFDTFTQVSSAKSREYGGTGLGLALSKKLVTLLNGDIVVQSKLGQGSVFTVYLPLETVEEERT